MNGHCFARRRCNYLTIIYKVKKKAKIRNRFNQTPHLTQDTVLESDKNTRKKSHTREPRGQPFQTGDRKAARNRHGKQTRNKTDQVSKNQLPIPDGQHFIRFGTKLYRQVVGIPMGTNCAPLVADLFLFCYERDFMMSLSDDKQDDVIDSFNTTSRYLDDILNINNVYFDNMVSQVYPSELQLNKANTSETEAAFLDLHLSI